MRESLNCYSVISGLRFNDLTIQLFNAAKPFVIRHYTTTFWKYS